MIVNQGFSYRPVKEVLVRRMKLRLLYIVGSRRLYTSLVVTIETNGEPSEGASIFLAVGNFVDTVSPLWRNVTSFVVLRELHPIKLLL